ncbi:MAG: Hsp20/alpha crystallin family protein [Patescibacteria group bacterium]
MALIPWRPMIEPFEDMSRFFDEVWPVGTFRALAGVVPAMDVYEDADNVYVETPLPGVDPEKVTVSVENDVLTIEGKSQRKTEVEDKKFYRKEVSYGSFHRAVALPSAVKGEVAKATYEKGVLKVIIPKEERVKPKTVKVEVK